MPTIKPIDSDIIIKAAKETGAIVTAEEHSIIGGLGSAVSEALAEEFPVPVVKLGVNDTFGKSGPANQLLDEFGLRAKDIAEKYGVKLEIMALEWGGLCPALGNTIDAVIQERLVQFEGEGS